MHKLEPKWSDGIWLGRASHSDEHIVAGTKGVMLVRTMKRKPETQQWDSKAIFDLKWTPWEPSSAKRGRPLKGGLAPAAIAGPSADQHVQQPPATASTAEAVPEQPGEQHEQHEQQHRKRQRPDSDIPQEAAAAEMDEEATEPPAAVSFRVEGKRSATEALEGHLAKRRDIGQICQALQGSRSKREDPEVPTPAEASAVKRSDYMSRKAQGRSKELRNLEEFDVYGPIPREESKTNP